MLGFAARMPDDTRKRALRARIERAFAARPYPGDDRLADAWPADPHYEGTIAARFLCGKDWRRLAFADIVAAYDAQLSAMFGFMRPEGVAYFLPSFLVMALDLDGDPRRPGYDQLYTFIDSLCFHLTRPSASGLSDQYELVKDMPEVSEEIKEFLRHPTPEARRAERLLVERHQRLVEILSDEERAAVADALDFIADSFRGDAPGDRFNSALSALESTWGRFRG